MEQEPRSESIPDHVVYEDTSIDGSLTLTVWWDIEPLTPLIEELGAMGTVRISDTVSNEIYHEERMVLSPSAIFGAGPIESETTRWSNIMALFRK